MTRKDEENPSGPAGSSNRRDFLHLAVAAGLSTVTVLSAPRQEQAPPPGPAVACAVVGTGLQGRKLLGILSRLPHALTIAYCDIYPPYLRRSARLAPEAAAFADHARMLEEAPSIEAVFVATPTHLHRRIVEDCLASGKHVYCEAPIASTLEGAGAIARAARRSSLRFAAGQQLRANPHYTHALKFLEIDAIGRPVTGSGYYHANNSWRRAAGDPAFEEQLNWRLSPVLSLGLLGEAGVHAFDTTLRSHRELPSAVSSFGSLMKWEDGRTVPDTVQAVVEFPSGFQSRFEATLTNSYGGRSELLHGTHGSLLLTEKRCWLFKEADATSLGWEVYARRERVVNEDGIVLVADATKLLAQSELPGQAGEEEARDSVEVAVDDFLRCVRSGENPACGPVEAYRAAALAVKAHEALSRNCRLEIEPELFNL